MWSVLCLAAWNIKLLWADFHYKYIKMLYKIIQKILISQDGEKQKKKE